MTRRPFLLLLVALLPGPLSACGALTQLSEIGRPPPMTPTQNPTLSPTWRPVTMPMPSPVPAPTEPASLWRSGSRGFFADQRATRVGDIVTVLVNMSDSGTLKNATSASRNGSGSSGGTGQIQRSEAVTLSLAGTVTQVLPNGNLVIAANQQVRVNSELVSLHLTGVIRPEDISSTNTINDDQIAEERISYGGTGQLTQVQTPSWGQQLLNILLPF